MTVSVASLPTSTSVVSVPGHFSGSTAVLPTQSWSAEGCTSLSQGGTAVVICRAVPEALSDKLLVSAPSVVMSAAALALSVVALLYNTKKDARARRQSIQDDFWLRKVISPVSVEPWVKFMVEVLANLPTETSTPDEIDKFQTTQLATLRSLTAAFRSTALLSAGLYSSIEKPIEEVEDRLAIYLGELDQFKKGRRPSAPSRPEAINDLATLHMSVLNPIKEQQSLVK